MKIPALAVSAYFDGKAHAIQTQVLGGLDRFEKAAQASDGQLLVRADGQRSPRPLQFAAAAAFAATGLAVAGAGLALAASGALMPGAVAGMLGLYVASLGEDHVRQALKAPDFKPANAGLQHLVQSNLRDFPSSRQVVCLAGHGNHERVGSVLYENALQGTKVEQVVLDTCLGGQLEVLGRLAPWSQFVTASCQPIPAVGLPLDQMFAPSQLNLSPRALASSFVEKSRGVTPSLAAWDCETVRDQLFPALDRLGHHLAHQVDRSEIRAALARSESPDWLPSARVDLGSFLRELVAQKCAHAQEALDAFTASLVNTQNDKVLTFNLARERDEESLPAGWREFLQVADLRRKPNRFF